MGDDLTRWKGGTVSVFARYKARSVGVLAMMMAATLSSDAAAWPFRPPAPRPRPIELPRPPAYRPPPTYRPPRESVTPPWENPRRPDWDPARPERTDPIKPPLERPLGRRPMSFEPFTPEEIKRITGGSKSESFESLKRDFLQAERKPPVKAERPSGQVVVIGNESDPTIARVLKTLKQSEVPFELRDGAPAIEFDHNHISLDAFPDAKMDHWLPHLRVRSAVQLARRGYAPAAKPEQQLRSLAVFARLGLLPSEEASSRLLMKEIVTSLEKGLPATLELWQTTELLSRTDTLVQGVERTAETTKIHLQLAERLWTVESTRGSIRVIPPSHAEKEVWSQLTKRIKSLGDETLFAARATNDGGMELMMKDAQFTISKLDRERVERGQMLEANHPLRQYIDKHDHLILASSPLGQRPSSAAYRDSARFLFGLQESHRSTLFMRDDPSEAALKRAERVVALDAAGPKRIAAVVAGSDSGVVDYSLIQDLIGTLKKNNVRLFSMEGSVVREHGGGVVPASEVGAPMVVTFAGHANEALVKTLRTLGEADVFRGNLVLLNVCPTDEKGSATLTTQMLNELTERYGASGVFQYQGSVRGEVTDKVFYDDLRPFLKGLFETAPNQPKYLRKIQQLLEGLKLNGVWQITHRSLRISKSHRIPV